MKKVVFSMVGSMLIGLCAAQAQEYDTAGTASKSKQNKQRYEQSQKQRDQQRGQAWQQQSDRNQYAQEGMVIIEKDEIPSSLKKTLKEDKYAGWENGTIYRNTNTGEYVIAPRAYRFDESGKEIEAGNLGYGNNDGRSSRYSQDQNMQSSERTSQSQQGQDQRSESSTYSSGNQSDNTNSDYRNNQSSQTKRNQTYDTQPQSYEQATGNQQDQSSGTQQSTGDQSSATQQRSYGQSSQSGQTDDQSSSQSGTYSNDDSRQGQDQPSTGYRSGQNDQSASSQSGQSQSESQYRTEDMTEVQAEQIPASLRRTLKESQYRGWEENGTLYQDPSTNEYVLVMEKTSDSSEPRSYRFDRNGQVQDDQTSGQSSSGSTGASQRSSDR